MDNKTTICNGKNEDVENTSNPNLHKKFRYFSYLNNVDNYGETLKRIKQKVAKWFYEKSNHLGIIPLLLKAQRSNIDKSQRELAAELGVPYPNFLSMIENGTSKLPIARLPEFIQAYKLPEVMLPVFLRLMYPEVWRAALLALRKNPELLSMKDDDIDMVMACELDELANKIGTKI